MNGPPPSAGRSAIGPVVLPVVGALVPMIILILSAGCDGEAPTHAGQLVLVSPESVVVPLGGNVSVTARLVAATGESLPSQRIAWFTFDSTVAVSDSGGVVRGVRVGGTTLVAASGGLVGQVPLAVVTRYLTVTPAGYRTLALAENGAVYRWGDTARAITSESLFVSVSGGWSHACGVTAGGEVMCWGGGTPLGNGSHESSIPVPVTSAVAFRSVSVGRYFACAVSETGDVYCWGTDIYGVTGPNGSAEAEYPVLIPFPAGVLIREVSAGGYHACALSTASEVWCWGYARYGQLGVDTAGLERCPRACSRTPQAVSGGLRFAVITAGGWHTCALTTDGTLFCWGDNWDGALGDSVAGPCPYSGARCSWQPNAVMGETRFGAVSAGESHTCAVAQSGAGYCWGGNRYGMLGTGTNEPSQLPAAVAGGPLWQTIQSGSYHTCGMSRAGVTYCWGVEGALGIGAGRGSIVPARVLFQR